MSTTAANPASARVWVLAALVCMSPVAVGLGVLYLVLTLFTVRSATGTGAGAPAAVAGIDPVLLQAYTQAAARAPQIAPGCTGMRWSILAAIAQIESGQAAGRQISASGAISPPILGPRLDGSGAGGNTTAIRDTDQGRWDGDTSYDRAVGPFQFIPSSWRIFGQDGNGDGVSDPHNAFDAAAGAVAHLCGTGARNLNDPAQLREAILGYNHSDAYVAEVLGWIDRFDQAGAGQSVAPSGGSRAVTGCAGGPTASYPNGRIPLALLCPLKSAPQHRLQAGAAAAFDRLSDAYAQRFGRPICITDSYRSYEQQVRLKAEKPTLAAVPGTSNHGWGTAVDLCGGIETSYTTPQHTWMTTFAPTYGWINPAWARPGGSKREPWHWEFIR
jgi:hypothetical protein